MESMMQDDPYEDYNSPHVMLAFYRKLFPFKQIVQWLNYDHVPGKNFTHREIAFTLQNDAYLRYQSFATAEDFKKEVIRLNPSRFEIGPVYTSRPCERKIDRRIPFKPVSRELVFDIDMTDYDEIRTCCSGKGICRRCWKFIAIAVKVIDRSIREDFGFKHLLWVYSGRRGVHLWVSDAAARRLTDEGRRAIATYLEVIRGGQQQSKKVNLVKPLHPSLAKALDLVKEAFQDIILEDQQCFQDSKIDQLLGMFPDDDMARSLRKQWKINPDRSSAKKWSDLKKYVDAMPRSTSIETLSHWEHLKCIDEAILQYTYPRLDAEVSKHMNHLLKSPFCVHPGTGRICVPVDPDAVDAFDPETVPTVSLLLNELDRAEVAGKVNGNGHASADLSSEMQLDENLDPTAGDEHVVKGQAEWKKTSLRPYVEMLEEYCKGLLSETRQEKRALAALSTNF